MIAYYLLTGAREATPETEEDYLAMVGLIAENAEARVGKVTRDGPLAGIVSNMLSKNLFEVPTL